MHRDFASRSPTRARTSWRTFDSSSRDRVREGLARPTSSLRGRRAVRDCGVRSSLRPVAAGFVAYGLFGGAFAVAAIDIERTFDLSDAGLGLLLAAGIITGTAVAAVGGVITDRWG